MIHIYLYPLSIYIYRERAIQRDSETQRERERERERDRQTARQAGRREGDRTIDERATFFHGAPAGLATSSA